MESLATSSLRELLSDEGTFVLIVFIGQSSLVVLDDYDVILATGKYLFQITCGICFFFTKQYDKFSLEQQWSSNMSWTKLHLQKPIVLSLA